MITEVVENNSGDSGGASFTTVSDTTCNGVNTPLKSENPGLSETHNIRYRPDGEPGASLRFP